MKNISGNALKDLLVKGATKKKKKIHYCPIFPFFSLEWTVLS